MSSSNMFYRYVLNPVMRGLLRSPLHGITSHNIGIVHFTGRKSGRRLNTPLSYTREGNIVRLLSNQSTRWWLNFRGENASVEMEIARQRYPGTAVLLEGDSEALREGVRRFIRALPRDAKVYGLQLDSNGDVIEASLASIAGELILVEIRLDG
ncbi:MAG: nitroreductase family deazaflavin-dependent oxidoreductase [Halioglobus sp.]|nr:nitroreductase family deazaflavin-dependent oxidoreductase [Halioglobus sp.]